MSQSPRWCLNLMKPRFYFMVLFFLIVYVITYFITSVDIFDNTPDGTSIDFSDAHKKELIESYRRELEIKHSEKVGNKIHSSIQQYDSSEKYSIRDHWVENKNEETRKSPGGSKHHTKHIERDTSTSDLDPDLADILYDSKGDDNFQKDTKVKPQDETNEKPDYTVDNENKVLNLDYDDGGNVVVNAAALLDYEEYLSNTTKILPKKTITYKCWEGAFYTEPYLLSKPVGKVDFECMDLRVTPSTPICLYKSEEDVFISAYLRYNGLWEGHIVDQIQRALSKDKELGLIDLGANLGQYSLIAAKMGRKVFAVEPYSQTLRRFQKAAQMGDLIPNIRVLKNAIADVRKDMYIHLNPDNMGDARVNTDNSTCKKNCELVRSILISDIVPYLNFNKAVLKIDIQGYEDVIFYYADHLLNNIYIPYIFMEWVLLREFYVHQDHNSAEKRDVEFTITYLTVRGYIAYSSINGKKLNLEHWGGWPEDVFWVLQGKGDANIFNFKALNSKYYILRPLVNMT